MTQMVWGVIGAVLVLGLGAGLRWLSSAIADKVTDQIGDALQERWEESIERAIAPIRAELEANGGSSVKDRVNDVWLRVGNLEQQLEIRTIDN